MAINLPLEQFAKPAVILVIAVVLFCIDGVEAVQSFINHETTMGWLGSLGTLAALLVGILAGNMRKANR